MDEIGRTDPNGPSVFHPRAPGPRENGENSFSRMIENSLKRVNTLQQEADRAIHGLVVANETDIHETMIAMEKASVSFKLLMAVRNKVVGAYEEIMRMNI